MADGGYPLRLELVPKASYSIRALRGLELGEMSDVGRRRRDGGGLP